MATDRPPSPPPVQAGHRGHRIAQVASGIYKLMRATDKDIPQIASELTEDDRKAMRDIAEGLVTIWDALNDVGR